MSNNISISEKSKSIIYDYPIIKKRTDMAYTELRQYTHDWQKFQQIWMYNYTVRDLLKTGANVSYYVFESSAERKSYKAGQASHVAMYPNAAAKGVFNDIQHTIPDTPVFTSVVGADASVTLTWTVPASNESSILSYTITAYDASNNITAKVVTSATGSSNTFKFTGLVNGISYMFTIYATNDIGNSYTSAFTNVVIPKTIPEQPAAFVVFQENNYFITQWLVPLNGGSAITSYVLTLCDASNNILMDASNNIIQNVIRDDGVLNTREGLLIVTNTDGVQVPYTIGEPIASNLVIGNYYSFKLLARNAAGDSLITTLAAPVRFIKIPAQAPLWVAGSDLVYNASEDRLTFKFTQTADDRNITTSYTFSSIPLAIERSLTIQNTTTTNLGGVIQVVASIVGIPDNTYTFTVYAYNLATRVEDYRISLKSSPVIVSNI
jgi:hypothetical protein